VASQSAPIRIGVGKCGRQHFFGSPFLLVRFLLAKQKKMNEGTDDLYNLKKYLNSNEHG
jgi:hypothetical protein